MKYSAVSDITKLKKETLTKLYQNFQFMDNRRLTRQWTFILDLSD